MDDRAAPFEHRLGALLRKESWEGEVLGLEVARAREALHECQRRQREATDLVERLQGERRAAAAEGMQLSLERCRVIDLYLRHQHEVAAARQQESARAERMLEQALQQLEHKRRSIRMLEVHEERARDEHQREHQRRQLKAHDDAWLMRQRPQKGSR